MHERASSRMKDKIAFCLRDKFLVPLNLLPLGSREHAKLDLMNKTLKNLAWDSSSVMRFSAHALRQSFEESNVWKDFEAKRLAVEGKNCENFPRKLFAQKIKLKNRCLLIPFCLLERSITITFRRICSDYKLTKRQHCLHIQRRTLTIVSVLISILVLFFVAFRFVSSNSNLEHILTMNNKEQQENKEKESFEMVLEVR